MNLSWYARLPQFPGKLFLGGALLKLSPPTSAFVTQTMRPGFRLNLRLKDRIQRRMFIKGNHEPETEVAVRPLAKKSQVFFDIGANIGYVSALAASENPQIQILAFEPMPNNRKEFAGNMELKQFSHYEIFPYCLSDQEGEVSFASFGESESGWGQVVSEGEQRGQGETIKCQAKTLDSLWNEGVLGHQLPDLIKIDVEGHELHVLQGAVAITEAPGSRVFCVELNEPNLKQAGTSAQEILVWFSDRGFMAHMLNRRGDLIPTTEFKEDYPYMNYFFIK